MVRVAVFAALSLGSLLFQTPSVAHSATPMHIHADAGCMYIVQPGDTLSKIDPNGWQNVTVPSGDPNLIYPGQELNLCENPTPNPPVMTAPLTTNAVVSGEPCQSNIMFPGGTIQMWQIPVGCYAGVYPEAGLTDCYSWVARLFGGVGNRSVHWTPVPGAILHFSPGVQGASPEGHWAVAVAVQSPWVLVSESNNWWRGGWGEVTYRYVLETSGIAYYY